MLKISFSEYSKFPKSLNDTKQLGSVLLKYKEKHYYDVLLRISTIYILLQSFAIPGSVFFTMLSGYLFNVPIALSLVCTCSACGATICYCISNCLGRHLILKWFPGYVKKYQDYIASCGDNLFFYLVFLRITPFLPNWFINVASPIVGVPLRSFFIATLIGVAPPSIVIISAGTALQALTSVTAAWSWKSVVMVILCALFSLAPIGYQKFKSMEKQKII
ncbi:unnamed protein product [Dracunculus medinensis]|uniref:Transmembrane protein n=1 Tax=Dracunculus medinensis TaxID=318479 RepID=A0A0N4UD41_DRAME|nr:unnamed protein product [Dracunculus medinensis]